MSKQSTNYYHLNSSDIARLPLTCESVGENSSQKIYSHHDFYEGAINNNNRGALFFLQKSISSKTEFDRVTGVISDMSIANVQNLLSQDKTLLGNERFERYSKAEELFRKYDVPQNLKGKWELSAAHALYQRFAKHANIFVPGYVMGVSVNEHGQMVSQIERIPLNEQPEIERKIRERNLNGRLNFW